MITSNFALDAGHRTRKALFVPMEHSSPFRHDIPVYRPPARAVWESRTGHAPEVIESVPDRKVRRVLEAIGDDLATIDRPEAIDARNEIADVCEGIHRNLVTEGIATDRDAVFFDA